MMLLKFKHGDNVIITKGFYRGNTGTVNSYSKFFSFFGIERYTLWVVQSSCGYYVEVNGSEIELVSSKSPEKRNLLIECLKRRSNL